MLICRQGKADERISLPGIVLSPSLCPHCWCRAGTLSFPSGSGCMDGLIIWFWEVSFSSCIFPWYSNWVSHDGLYFPTVNLRCIPGGFPCGLGIPRFFQGIGTTDPSGLLPHKAVLLADSEESLHSLTFTSVGAPNFSRILATFTMLSVVFLNEVLPVTQEGLLFAQLSLLSLCRNVEGPKGQSLFL